MINSIVGFIRDIYRTNEFIPLHAPAFNGNEKKYVLDTIKSTFVSSVGQYVDDLEKRIEMFTHTPKAVATLNGTAALHAALYIAGVERDDLVITQTLTFVATCNAIYHLGAEPVFVDITKKNFGLCPRALESYLQENAMIDERGCIHKETKRRIRAVIPMHTFGHPVELDEFMDICGKWRMVLVEDAAESLGSYYKGTHTGTIGAFGTLSFNGNKIITTGGGGVILCRNKKDGDHAKHVTTTAKVPHQYDFYHDEPGFNYRMPNLNAALGCAQMESLAAYLQSKRELASHYEDFFKGSIYDFVKEPPYATSNYWLNTIVCEDIKSRDYLLKETNSKGIMTRPVWKLMHKLPMFKNSIRGNLDVSKWAESRLVNLPSSPIRKVNH